MKYTLIKIKYTTPLKRLRTEDGIETNLTPIRRLLRQHETP